MAKQRATRRPSYAKADCRTVDLRSVVNFPSGRARGKFLQAVVDRVKTFPSGRQALWGIPFTLPSGKSCLLKRDAEVRIRLGAKADYLCFVHTFYKDNSDSNSYTEMDPVGEYELRYADGTSRVLPVRARLEVQMPGTPGTAQLAVPWKMSLALDPEAIFVADETTPRPFPNLLKWGPRQRGAEFPGNDPWLCPMRNPQPEKAIREVVLRGLRDSPLLVIGLTLYRGTAHPLRHLARRMYRVRVAGKPVKVESATVDLGGVARVDRSIGPRDKDWLKSPYAGGIEANEPEKKGEDILNLYGARDATVTVKLAGRAKPVGLSLGEAHETGVSRSGDVRLERLGGSKQWVQVRILDERGRPAPARLHISGAGGEYIAPYGHPEQVNANWFEDYGADLKLGNRNYACVPGAFTTDLPTGDLYIELLKGFEYAPLRTRVTLRPGEKTLTLRLKRWTDLRRQGWVTADTHVHFLSPHTAWLEAQCEGVNVVNLLASQWGRLFTNVGDITGRVGVVEDDTVVWVGTENRNHMLGHISMLGTKGLPVYPMCGGGIEESYLGDPDYRTLSEWARECRRKDGVVVRPHFPNCGFTEDAVMAALGVVDALEIRTTRDRRFPLVEWYRYLNNGYRVACVGGTDKMGAYMPIGAMRTYALLDPGRPFTYEAWARAVRAGRTYATTGPLMDLRVEGRRIGDTVHLPAGGGTVQVNATAESAWPLGVLEVVYNGRVVADTSSRASRALSVSAKVPADRPGWLAARAYGAEGRPGANLGAHTSPVYVACGRRRPFDGPAMQHMLNLTRGGIEYLETISTPFSARDQERMIRIYRDVERHFLDRLRSEGRP